MLIAAASDVELVKARALNTLASSGASPFVFYARSPSAWVPTLEPAHAGNGLGASRKAKQRTRIMLQVMSRHLSVAACTDYPSIGRLVIYYPHAIDFSVPRGLPVSLITSWPSRPRGSAPRSDCAESASCSS